MAGRLGGSSGLVWFQLFLSSHLSFLALTGNQFTIKLYCDSINSTAARGEFFPPSDHPRKLSSVLIIDLFLLIKLIFVKLIIFLINVSNQMVWFIDICRMTVRSKKYE